MTTIGQIAQLTVTDDGPGVAADDRERIFSHFSRRDQARARDPRGGGTGLGLSITRQIVETASGTISVEDRPDGKNGAVFVLQIPLAQRSRCWLTLITPTAWR